MEALTATLFIKLFLWISKYMKCQSSYPCMAGFLQTEPGTPWASAHAAGTRVCPRRALANYTHVWHTLRAHRVTCTATAGLRPCPSGFQSALACARVLSPVWLCAIKPWPLGLSFLSNGKIQMNMWFYRICGEGNGNPFQYSCLENPMDRGAWRLQSTGLQRVRQNWVTKA